MTIKKQRNEANSGYPVNLKIHRAQWMIADCAEKYGYTIMAESLSVLALWIPFFNGMTASGWQGQTCFGPDIKKYTWRIRRRLIHQTRHHASLPLALRERVGVRGYSKNNETKPNGRNDMADKKIQGTIKGRKAPFDRIHATRAVACDWTPAFAGVTRMRRSKQKMTKRSQMDETIWLARKYKEQSKTGTRLLVGFTRPDLSRVTGPLLSQA
ncbi:MAG: hypothetical protein AB1483_01665 [Candidatus Zixiibacteriota bacterium]